MNSVFITGFGIVSSIGCNADAVLESFLHSRSGIEFSQSFREMGLSSHVVGAINLDARSKTPAYNQRFMTDAGMWSYIAATEAIQQAAITPEDLASPRTAVIAGTSGVAGSQIVAAIESIKEFGYKKISKNAIARCMSSSIAANLSIALGTQGPAYSLSSACSTSGNCIGHGADLIKIGKSDIVIAGGAEDVHWLSAAMFNSMGALSTKFNDRPSASSRPYDRSRDGFVLSGGAAYLIMESARSVERRGAIPLAELAAYSSCSDGGDMVQPSISGIARCIGEALEQSARGVDYINAHGTGTLVGDIRELHAIHEVFGKKMPLISSTKGLTGHGLGAAAAQEAVYSIIMLRNRFVAPSVNIEEIDEAAEKYPIVLDILKSHEIQSVMSVSLGFGGANTALIFRQP